MEISRDLKVGQNRSQNFCLRFIHSTTDERYCYQSRILDPNQKQLSCMDAVDKNIQAISAVQTEIQDVSDGDKKSSSI